MPKLNLRDVEDILDEEQDIQSDVNRDYEIMLDDIHEEWATQQIADELAEYDQAALDKKMMDGLFNWVDQFDDDNDLRMTSLYD